MRLVVSGATTFKKRGMTVPESTSTSTAGNYRTGSAERNQGAVHLPVKKAISKKLT
jgi:hypothetical protein